MSVKSSRKKRRPSRKAPPRLKPISLYPLKPEEVLAAFMQVDPGRVLRAGCREKDQKKRVCVHGPYFVLKLTDPHACMVRAGDQSRLATAFC